MILLKNKMKLMNKSIEFLKQNHDIIKVSFVTNLTGLAPSMISRLMSGSQKKLSVDNAVKIDKAVNIIKSRINNHL